MWLSIVNLNGIVLFNISDTPPCNKTLFTCGNESSQCIPLSWVCDKDPECSDGNDESENLCKNAGACGGNFTAPSGFIYSPSYPDNYPGNADCIYTISQPTGTIIRLNTISMNTQLKECTQAWCDPCEYDYLEIRDGTSYDSPLLDKQCGIEIFAPIQSSQNQLWMK